MSTVHERNRRLVNKKKDWNEKKGQKIMKGKARIGIGKNGQERK